VPTARRAHDPYAALRIAAFRRYIAGLLTLILATQVQGVVVAWQVYAVTKDPLSLGLIGLAEALPFIGFALWAGHVADRVDRRKLTMGATAVLLLCSAALLALSLAPPAPRAHVTLIYAVIFVSGIARSFLSPARTALSTELVPRELLANSLTWRSTTWQTAAVGGPALGGVLYAFAGAPMAYALDTLLMLVALAAFVRVRHTPRPRPPTGVSIRRSLLEGIRFVRGTPTLLGAMSLDLFSVLFGGAVALLPIFADEILRVGPEGLGVLRAAPAVGAVAVSLWLAHRPPVRRTGPVLLSVVAAFGALMIGFGLSRSFALSVALLAASGAVDMVSVNIRSMLLQLLVPEHLLGRVSSVNQIFIGSSNEIGAFESGVAAKLLGAAQSVVVGGALTILVVVTTGWAVPALRRMGEIPQADDRAVA
jgi:MFS family permease